MLSLEIVEGTLLVCTCSQHGKKGVFSLPLVIDDGVVVRMILFHGGWRNVE